MSRGAKVEKYLDRNGLALPDRPTGRPLKIVIPALGESETLPAALAGLARLAGAERAEVFVVVNNAEGDASERFADNQRTLADLADAQRDGRYAPLALAVLDRSSPSRGLPPEIAGVGAARKAGLNAALADLLAAGVDGLLVSLDADCAVSDNYLVALDRWRVRGEGGAAVLAYEHPLPDDPAARRAIALYEIKLRYTQAMLSTLPTPYRFATIGSTIACRPEAYVLAGGMNRRKATEDFYFLMHLAKAVAIDALDEARVFPSPRVSDRVYLGTGHGVGRLIDGSDLVLEAPECYRVVGRFLDDLLGAFGQSPAKTLSRIRERHEGLWPYLGRIGIETALPDALRGVTGDDAYARRVHTWFDGLRLRQAVHHARDHGGGAVPWADALRAMGLDAGDDPVPALIALRIRR